MKRVSKKNKKLSLDLSSVRTLSDAEVAMVKGGDAGGAPPSWGDPQYC